MNKDQGVGIFERMIYLAILPAAMKLVEKGYITTDLAIYIAISCQGLPSLAYGWWINRPSALLSSAGAQLPKNSALVITTSPQASLAEKVEANALADSASDKVSAKTTA